MVLKKKTQAETYGINGEWKLTKDKLYLMIEDKEGNTSWHYVSKYLKVTNVKQVSETNDTTLTLQYLYKGKYQTIDILRDQILQLNEFQKLSRKGIDVIHSNVKSMVQFLRIQEDSAPYEMVHNHMGWHEEEEQLYFKHYLIVGSKPPTSKYFGDYNIQPRGTLQGWLDIVDSEVIGNRHLELALAFGFSAPVVGLLSKVKDMDTLIVHIYGNSTQGKTTAAQLAVSPFGRPSKNEKGLIKSWSATHNAIVALLRDNYGIPIVLDEASMNTMKDYTSLLYMFAENREKERMNKEGELRKQRSWSTTIISTAEHSLFEKTNENAGLRMRAFEFGNFTWTSSADNSNQLKAGLLDNYGHAGIEFVQYLIELGVENVVERCERWKAYCEENLPQTEFLSRVSEKFGILLATAEMINESLNLSLNIESIMKILYDVEKESAVEREMADKSYEYMIEKVMQHSKNFIIESQEHEFSGNECWGKINFAGDDVEVSIFPHKFKQLLKEGNYSDPRVICKDWKEKGYLKSESGKFTKRSKVPIDKQVRETSGLTAPDSKGRDTMYVIVMNKELSGEFGITKLLSMKEIAKAQRKPRSKF